MTDTTDTPVAVLRVGVSACLLGERVRYDAGHKLDAHVCEAVGRVAQLVPLCPEVEIGLGVPRPTIQLERRGAGGRLRLIEPGSGRDLTATMADYARRKAAELERLGLSGLIVKSRSPSCGRQGVPVHGARGPTMRTGRGRFTAELMRQLPQLPIEESDRLHDPRGLERFIARVLEYHGSARQATPP